MNIDHPCFFRSLSNLPVGQIYVATPYTPYAEIGRAQDAYSLALEAMRHLGEKGFSAISPVVMGHLMPVDWPHEKWMRWCRPLLMASAGVVVPNIDKRERSAGVRQEVRWALDVNMPVVWM